MTLFLTHINKKTFNWLVEKGAKLVTVIEYWSTSPADVN